MHGDWVAAIAGIVAAVIGSLLTYSFDRYRATKKSLRFIIRRPERISQELKKHGTFIEVKIGNAILKNLNVATVTVKNASNVPLENISFDLVFPGNHPVALADRVVSNDKLREAIKIHFDQDASPTNRRFTISLPFFNKGESFDLKTFYDDPPEAPRIECRLVGIETRIDTAEEVLAGETRGRTIAIGAAGATALFSIIVLILSVAAAFQSRQREAEIVRHVFDLQRTAPLSPDSRPDVPKGDRLN